MRNQLLRLLDTDRQHRSQVIDQSSSVRSGLVEEVQTIINTLDFQYLILIVTEEQLLQEVEGLLMGDFLTNLHRSSPRMWSEFLLTILALLVVFSEFAEEGLLHVSIIHDFLLNCETNLYAFRRGVRVHECSIDNLYLGEASESFEADGKQLLRLSFAQRPRWPEISVAELTVVDNTFLGDA